MASHYHYLLSNRQIWLSPGKHKPTLNTSRKKLAAKGQLYFGLYKARQNKEYPVVNKVLPAAFAGGVRDHIKKLPQGKRDVLLYIHGYDALPGLKLELLDEIHRQYVERDTGIGSIIFLSWPSHGFFRNRADDRSNEYGEEFFDHIDLLADLAQQLEAEQSRLHLMVHSFGHQFLNGFINAEKFASRKGKAILQNIFLMAPDIPRDSLNQGGILFHNRQGRPARRLYDFTRLNKLGKQIHVFHDRYDYLLYVSSKFLIDKSELRKQQEKWRSKGENMSRKMEAYTAPYQVLGCWGPPRSNSLSGFHFHDINELQRLQLLELQGRGRNLLPEVEPIAKYEIDQLRQHHDYHSLTPVLSTFIKDLFRKEDQTDKWINRHRYFITGEAVVSKVREILAEGKSR